jgi:small subunit ribosomal protein S1
LEDYSEEPGFSFKDKVAIGDELSATVIRRDDGEGHILMSRKEANDIQAWDKLQEMMDQQTVINVKINAVVNAGVIAYVEGIRGFIPASKLSLNYVEDTSEWLSKEIPVRVITVNASDRKLVLSAKELLQEQSATERNSRVASIPVGLVTEGTVDSLQTYGAFINLGNGLSGLVHISQISSKRIKSPAAVLHIGDTVKVKVIDTKDGKISLSMKALEEAISEEIVEESYDLPETEEVSTSLGSLFANIKLK